MKDCKSYVRCTCIKRVLALFFFISTLILCLTAYTASAESNDSLNWEFDGGTLIISGTGSTSKYAQNGSNKWPWKEYSNSITHIKIEEGITDVGFLLFKDLKGLKSVSLPSTVTVIVNHAFEGCSALESIYIPESVVSIGEYTFEGCESLTKVTLNEGIQSIGYYAFKDCISLTEINIPSSLMTVNSTSFYNTPVLNNADVTNGATYIGNILLSANNVDVADYTVKNGTTVIADDAFGCIDTLKKVTLPDGLIRIGSYAFTGCSNLETVIIPEGVESIGAYAFYKCKALKSVKLPETLTTLGGNTFEECTALTEITLPESVKYVPYGLCNNCTSLKAAYLPKEVDYIGSYAFNRCFELETVRMPEKAGSLGQSAFCSCYKLKEIDLPEGITYIGSIALYGVDMTEVVIPDTVTSIDYRAFAYCDKLRKVTMSKNLEVISYEVFTDCISLSEIDLPETLKFIDDMAFNNCQSLKTLTLHKSVTKLGYSIFRDCPDLVVKCDPDTYAHDYLMKNRIPYEFIVHCEHSFTNYITDLKVNCTDNITKTAVCDKGCGKKSTIIIEGTAEEHSKSEWVVTKAANYISEGIRSLKCSKCSYVYDTESIPVLEYNGFIDVPKNAWYAEGADYCFKKGYIVGNEAGSFLPSTKLTREQFVVILARIEKADLETPLSSEFVDVKPSSWYAPAVEWAVAKGYVMGIGDSKFGVGRFISRQELAVLLYRISAGNGINTDTTAEIEDYEDHSEIADWATEEVKWAVYAGLFTSTDTNHNLFSPKMSVTRAQIAKILMCYDSYTERN